MFFEQKRERWVEKTGSGWQEGALESFRLAWRSASLCLGEREGERLLERKVPSFAPCEKKEKSGEKCLQLALGCVTINKHDCAI